MKKSFNVDPTFNDMRIDRWIRNNLGNYPQGLIEKSLKSGKVKINKKKIKSSHKVKTGDIIDLFNFDFKETIVQKTIKFVPSEEVVKENEDLIIDNNDDFIVLNKSVFSKFYCSLKHIFIFSFCKNYPFRIFSNFCIYTLHQ